MNMLELISAGILACSGIGLVAMVILRLRGVTNDMALLRGSFWVMVGALLSLLLTVLADLS